MSISIGRSTITTDGLVLLLDPADSSNYTLSNVEVLVVAGGGGGGTNGSGNDIAGGGGGAGGLVYNSSYNVTPGSAITVTVGNGGGTSQNTVPTASQNSVFDTITVVGGGRGAGYAGGAYFTPTSGGSGGGGTYANNSGADGTTGQGNKGGRGTSSSVPGAYAGGGGGGAGQSGENTNRLGKGGDGGDGLPFSISGSLIYYAGGGGGGTGYQNQSYRLAGKGGRGGGGNGSDVANGRPAVPNTGGGGGGAGNAGGAPYSNGFGGAGGSGVVIVRYPGPQKATGGNTITQVGGYTIHTFTTSGTFTPLSFPSNNGTVYGLANLINGRGVAIARGGGITYQSYSSRKPALRTPENQISSYVELPEYILQTLPNGETWTMEFAATLLTHSAARYGPHMTVSGGNDLIFQWLSDGTAGLYNATLVSGSLPTWTLNTTVMFALTRNYSNWGLYKNGVFAAEYTYSMTNVNNIQGWILDQEQDALKGGFDPNQNINADWHHFSFYDRVLSASEIQTNFGALRGRLSI